ncbi:hypothetical protein P3L10_000936 [Capsicum annuum]|uniref:uncharacterized protein LOC107873227 n=1 Tax=Capsicum annuum TaxID=4072 RepID=UPI0007BF5F13|nr:uncharacterized protein LOC107873227 [Capsicum annuum]
MGLVFEIQAGEVWGVVRNNIGGWVRGFAKAFSWTTNNHMEILALRKGLQMVEDHNLIPVDINIDSMEMISLLSSGNPLYNAIIDNCRLKLNRLRNLGVFHCYKEQNGVADALTKWGASEDIQLETTFFVVPPMCAHQAV